MPTPDEAPTDSPVEPEGNPPAEVVEEKDESIPEHEVSPAKDTEEPSSKIPEPVNDEVKSAEKRPVQDMNVHPTDEQQALAEQEIARLNAEVERLRMSMAGAVDVIEELETPPMPPAVIEDIVIGAHIVSDFARLARQLDREQLIRATMGTIAMLHPDNLGIMVSTRNRVMLPRLDERGLCAGFLGKAAPRGAPADWRTLEVILALASSAVTGGPAAVIHSHGPYTTAASCEKDLVLVQPIDVLGKEQIGNVIIVDPDDGDPADFLKQITEALYQGGMRCVVVRGMGAYAVGANLDQAWSNAAMLEHSMRIVLLARQANLKV
ncbi:class II aldolase/adducin family protein [Euryarchaeota archaeon]|nr:class II aldolase/adducin family protein [Euryarchaeota archaeon]MDA8728211.1 class II aldolase/adducin family protein [Euryarchaeota archaeon]